MRLLGSYRVPLIGVIIHLSHLIAVLGRSSELLLYSLRGMYALACSCGPVAVLQLCRIGKSIHVLLLVLYLLLVWCTGTL